MDVIIRSNNNPVNDMTVPVNGLINDLDKDIKTKSSQCLFGRDKQILGGCLRNREGQTAVQ